MSGLIVPQISYFINIIISVIKFYGEEYILRILIAKLLLKITYINLCMAVTDRQAISPFLLFE